MATARPLPMGMCLFCVSRRAQRLARNPLSTRSYTRHPSAPKPSLDIRHIVRNPGLYQQNCASRNYKSLEDYSFQIAALSEERVNHLKDSSEKRKRNAEVKRRIERMRRAERAGTLGESEGTEAWQSLVSEAQTLKQKLGEADRKTDEMTERMEDMAMALPNLSSVHTPDGSKPKILATKGSRTAVLDKGNHQSHVAIGETLSILDFPTAGNTSGWGWYFLMNEGALLEQALVQYALHTLRRRGWTVVSPPSVVWTHIAEACGFQPRDQNDEQQVYSIVQPERHQNRPPHSLSGTAEIPLAGMFAQRTIAREDLPIKMVASSRCFRAEAGARGIDTKGLYRVHEFTKVEMFAWTLPDNHGMGNFDTGESGHSHSTDVFNEMVCVQREILDSLGLVYRVLEMPATDLGASAARKIDMEVFFPSRRCHEDGWGEVSSTSICTDYQSRRLGVKCKDKFGALVFPHTVNGTAMAIPRMLAAIMETWFDFNRQEMEVPEVLRPWMDGIRVIRPKKLVEEAVAPGPAASESGVTDQEVD